MLDVWVRVELDPHETETGNEAMYAEERRQALIGLARAEGRVSVSRAAREFRVTAETIRRDLAALDGDGPLRRVHGGAVPVESLDLVERDVAERLVSHAAEKARIARAALSHLPSGVGSSLLLDAGTTTAQLAAVLTEDARRTVVTNSVTAATTLAARGVGEVHVLGGRLRPLTQAVVGASALAELAALRVDVAVLGTNGVTVEHGCSTPHPEEAAVKAAMVRAARRVVVLADSSKIGRDQLRSFVAVTDVDVLVTDSGISAADRSAFSQNGIEVVVA